MKALAFSLTLIAALSLSARADFTIVQKVEKKELKGKGEANEVILKVKGDKIRMEVTPKITMIVEGRTGDTITLLNDQKKVMRISGEKAKAIAEMAAKYRGNSAEKPKLIATGKKMTINGYEADEYVAEGKGSKARYWIAPSFPNSTAMMKQLQAVIPASWNDLAKGMVDYHDLPGLPLRSEVTVGEDNVISTVVSVKTDTLAESEFLPPKDFQEVKIPQMEISADKPTPTTK
ncbi:MAG TPA: DUF4412 domain-containing protein [Chthoniobacterales bacterium]|nr:DUF4412 domain-containing protein [Chthoniobacterales bacterium]